MTDEARHLRTPILVVACFCGGAAGCAAIVGADFDVSARPPADAQGGIEGPSISPSWSVTAPPGDTQLVGLSVAVEGDTALIGARNKDWVGLVFVVRRSFLDAWDIVDTLTAGSYASSNAVFGSSVALSGDWAIVGASAQPKNAPGTAYFFKRTGDTWTMAQGEVTAPIPADGDRFGTRVAIENDLAVVGAPGAADGNTPGGAVHLFSLGSDGSWSNSATLLPPGGVSGDSFGEELALHSTTLVVGAPFDDEVSPDSGAAYVFERRGVDWTQPPQKLIPRTSVDPSYRMGSGTIGLGEGLLIVPASTQVEAFQVDSTGNWIPDEFGLPRGLVSRPNGWRAAISGNKAITAVRTSQDVGMGLLYERVNGTWKFVERMEANSPTQDVFGWTVAYDGATACFGAIFFQDKKGAVYFFNLSP